MQKQKFMHQLLNWDLRGPYTDIAIPTDVKINILLVFITMYWCGM